MPLRLWCLAILFGIASFGAIGLFAPGNAVAHPGHSTHAAGPETLAQASDCLDAQVSSPDEGGSLAGRCLTVCCTGSGCCPPSLASMDQETPVFPTALKRYGSRVTARPDFAVEPLPEPPRSFV
jgi:hypothetical protein